MGATPEHLSESNVADMAAYLRGIYDDVNKLDDFIHSFKDRLRLRLYTFELAADPEFAATVAEAERRIESGEAREDAFTSADL